MRIGLIVGLVCFLFIATMQGQNLRYVDARDLSMVGKACSSKEFYHRLDTVLFKKLPSKIKYLSTHSCGLAIGFVTNSTIVAVKWTVKPDKPSANLSAIAQKGLDLYIKRNGVWEFAGVGIPDLNENSCEGLIVQNMDSQSKECLLYLPLFSEVKSLEIGIEEDSSIFPLQYPFKKKVLIYGSSIVHGAEASRPGTTYVAKLSRRTGIDFINLGFSGNARMENSMADCLASLNADAYLLDCVPNVTAGQVVERTAYIVKTIRKAHPKVPIIVMQSIAMDIGNFDAEKKNDLRMKNELILAEVEKLWHAGMQELYFIEGEKLIGYDHEGTGDGIHPNDLGFERMAACLSSQLLDILKYEK